MKRRWTGGPAYLAIVLSCAGLGIGVLHSRKWTLVMMAAASVLFALLSPGRDVEGRRASWAAILSSLAIFWFFRIRLKNPFR